MITKIMSKDVESSVKIVCCYGLRDRAASGVAWMLKSGATPKIGAPHVQNFPP